MDPCFPYIDIKVQAQTWTCRISKSDGYKIKNGVKLELESQSKIRSNQPKFNHFSPI